MKFLPLFFFLICANLTAQEESVFNAWMIDDKYPIIGNWELQDTIELEVYTRDDLWDTCLTYVKEVPSDKTNAPNDKLYYQTRMNNKTGEFYARTIRYTWIKRKIPLDLKGAKGGVKLRRNVENRIN